MNTTLQKLAEYVELSAERINTLSRQVAAEQAHRAEYVKQAEAALNELVATNVCSGANRAKYASVLRDPLQVLDHLKLALAAPVAAPAKTVTEPAVRLGAPGNVKQAGNSTKTSRQQADEEFEAAIGLGGR
jgi:hypothetical protein